MSVGHIVLELWFIKNGYFLENFYFSEHQKSCIFGTFFSKCYQTVTSHQNLTKPRGNDQEYPKFYSEKTSIKLSLPKPEKSILKEWTSVSQKFSEISSDHIPCLRLPWFPLTRVFYDPDPIPQIFSIYKFGFYGSI